LIDSIPEGLAMFAARWAILLVALNLVISSAALCGTSGESQGKEFTITTCQPDPSFAQFVVLRLPQSASLSRFIPWKARPKIVLGDTHSPLAEEDDLGPVPFPRGPVSPRSIQSTASRLPTLLPLRC